MSGKWQKAYSELEDYVAGNQQIKIGPKVVAIPADFKDDFYRLFNLAREEFVKEKLPTIFSEGVELSNNYKKEADELMRTIGLADIKPPPQLVWLLGDPLNGLIRPLLDPLFDLLKGKVNIKDFEFEAQETVGGFCGPLFKIGYENWVILSLANILAPERALAIPYSELKGICYEMEPDQKTGVTQELVPALEKLKTLLLGHEGYEPPFIVADIIVHSTLLNRYVSIRGDLTDAGQSAKNVSDNREWIKLRELGKIQEPILDWPSLVMYLDDQPDNIGLVSDFSRFCRPDVIIECMAQSGWYQGDGLDRVKKHYDFFKPKLGSYIVSRFPVPEEAFKELNPEAILDQASDSSKPPEEKPEKWPQNIHILTVGYDRNKLTPIIEALSALKSDR